MSVPDGPKREPQLVREPIPYGIDSWYPVLRGGGPPSLFVDAADGRSGNRLQNVWESLPEGGRVVLQAKAGAGSLPDLRALEAGLRGHGHAERFSIYPGTGGSFTLLSTRDAAAMRGGMALLPRGRARGRALWSAIGALAPLGVPRRLGRPEIAIWTKGAEYDETQDLPVLPVAGSVAVAAGVPDRNQKVIVRALDRRGAARAILKIGFHPRSDDSVHREARALERVARECPGRCPQLIAEGERAGRRWIAQEVLSGSRGSDGITEAHADFLVELAGVERRDVELVRLDPYQEAVRQLRELDPAFDPDWHDEYSALASALAGASEGTTFPVHFGHGDFTPWNLSSRGKSLRAFDWEYFSDSQPALHDLVHYHVQTSVLVAHHPGERVFDELDRLFSGPGARLVHALGLERDDVLRLVALYVLSMGVSNEVLERLRPAPFAQAGWLRRARLALCRRLAGLLSERRLPSWTQQAGRRAA